MTNSARLSSDINFYKTGTVHGAGLSVGRCGVVGSTLAFGSTGHGFDSEHRYFSHHSASAFSKL